MPYTDLDINHIRL